ncbi:RNase H domain-containing protein [Trichonephila inaurata madagascariensis]|uniref:RNase H domain-containing protein n=1 Tax=Trichonephila inaurata madagascariensis TaxID=2747483 RepID=A0A8X6MH39_9ARAC|nr:RNase H domain-containing protein [Trichonephila inaurata madagascariensis]
MLSTLIRTVSGQSRSSIQYLKNWPKIMLNTGVDIISKLAKLDHRKKVCLQWIPSHVGVLGTRQLRSWLGGVVISPTQVPVLSHSEIHSLHRTKMNLTWRNPDSS